MDSSEKIDLHAEPPARPRKAAGRRLLLAITAIPTLATLLAFGGPWWEPLDLLSHLRVQYALVLGIIILAALFSMQWRVALVSALPLAINVGLILPLYINPTWFLPHTEFVSLKDDKGPELELMTYNLDAQMRQPGDEVLNMIRNAEADIIFLHRVTPENIQYFEYAVAPYRVLKSDPRNDGHGIALLVRVEIRSPLQVLETKLVPLTAAEDEAGPQAMEVSLNWHLRKVKILALRAWPPLSDDRSQHQAEQFEAVAKWALAQTQPVVVIGDLNTTPWSYHFRHLLAETGLNNSQLGHGVQGTWPATGGPLGQLPLDHCLLGPSLVASSRKLGPSLTSSHHSLLVTIQWASGAAEVIPPANFDDNDAPWMDGDRPRRGRRFWRERDGEREGQREAQPQGQSDGEPPRDQPVRRQRQRPPAPAENQSTPPAEQAQPETTPPADQ